MSKAGMAEGFKYPYGLNRKLSREDGRPVRTGLWRFNKQRWLRFHGKPVGSGSGCVGRISYLAKFDY